LQQKQTHKKLQMHAIEYQHTEAKKDRKIAIIWSLGSVLLFIILTLIMRFTIKPPLPVDLPPLKSDEVIEEFIVDRTNVKVTEEAGSEGQQGGEPSDAPLSDPEPQTERILTQNSPAETQAFSGNSNNSNTENNATNTTTSTSPSRNPFGTGGSGGGNGGGRGGSGFGNDNGTGHGDGGLGSGSGRTERPARTRLTSPETVDSDQSGVVYIQVTINAEGDVVKAMSISNRTTITDLRIVNQVLSNVKKQVKYNKVPGTPPQTQTLRIDVKAQ
jgi:hypothetical protein